MFVDKAKITVKAGDGGNGCCSFLREKFIPKGGPDGGDGGLGGNVIIRSISSESSLVDLIYQTRYAADNGTHGKGKSLHGHKGKDCIIKVPAGTVISDTETGEILADLSQADMEVVVAKGGRGGWGNPHFATSTNRAPRRCDPGQPGEERRLYLELKTIADVGFVGYPNAGKSTLLRALSSARPKVAPYPFTTLHPVVGVHLFPDYRRLTLADIPGLIDGAHANVGLGHDFLRHIERTSVLVYVLDMAGTDGRNPVDDLYHLREELELYMKGLSKRPAVIVANKMDVPEAAENLELLREALVSEVIEVIPAVADQGEIGELAEVLYKLVEIEKAKSPFSKNFRPAAVDFERDLEDLDDDLPELSALDSEELEAELEEQLLDADFDELGLEDDDENYDELQDEWLDDDDEFESDDEEADDERSN